MEKLDLSRQNLKKFGITMGVVFFAIAVFVTVRHRHNALPYMFFSASFFLFSFSTPLILKPLYVFWMRLSFILSWINTRLILIIIFYLIFSPLGFIIKLCGKDLLERKIDRSKSSYWIKKEKLVLGKLHYEKQF